MLGIEDYGSDDDDSDVETNTKSTSTSKPTSSSKLALPAPKISSFSLPPPKTTAKRPKKKISIALPSLPTDDTEDDQERPAKKPRREGAGSSLLLSMLPAPKLKTAEIAKERILGGGSGRGLVFNTASAVSNPVEISKPYENEDSQSTNKPSFAFLPGSLAKGKSNISVEEETRVIPPKSAQTKAAAAPAVDFFSLGSSSKSTTKPETTTSTSTSNISISAAPVVPTFTPPEPTPTDQYPGYYTLPSGAWAAYDPTYYAAFLKKWEKEYNDQVRALEKGMGKGFEGADDASVEEINAMKEMEKARVEIREREEKKAVTKDANPGPVAPRMNINASKLGKAAKSRHQLSTLLTEAYQNREALEERIAEGRRNRKEAGNKYGF